MEKEIHAIVFQQLSEDSTGGKKKFNSQHSNTLNLDIRVDLKKLLSPAQGGSVHYQLQASET